MHFGRLPLSMKWTGGGKRESAREKRELAREKRELASVSQALRIATIPHWK